MELPATKQEKIKLTEINQYLTCYLCKGYLIDATTISECLHSFCRSCIIKFLQDNSYCPVCELIINKAKPNLKLDKTLQDIVYKLVPELFLKEMLRRKTFYKNYPQIAARVSPEERGEDTERTIFNPQEMISLSLEYICDDSTPGAIRIPGIAIGPETLKNNSGSTEENQESQMKRYLLCPGMCRIEVLKKFVRNKYNVDTSQFFIDLLYKRVPLPDHYTLIDIAYIYSWQRNELMKFFFRIIDRSKAKRTNSPDNSATKFLPRQFRRTKSNGEKINVTSKRKEAGSDKKSHRKSVARISNSATKHSSQTEVSKGVKVCDNKSTVTSENDMVGEAVSDNTRSNNVENDSRKKIISEPCKDLSDNIETNPKETERRLKVGCKKSAEAEYEFNEDKESLKETDKESAVVSDNKLDKENIKEGEVPKNKACDSRQDKNVVSKAEKNTCYTQDNSKHLAKEQTSCDVKEGILKTEQIKTEIKSELPNISTIKKEPSSPEKQSDKTEGRLILKVSKELLDETNLINSKAQNFTKPITKSYTSITLNRSENVEIITKIEPVSNKDGKPIGHHIIKQTIKKGQKLKSNSPKKVPGKSQVTIPRLVISKKTVKRRASPKLIIKPVVNDNHPNDDETEAAAAPTSEPTRNEVQPSTSEAQQTNNDRLHTSAAVDLEDEKSRFLKCVDLTPTSSIQVKSETSPPPESPVTIHQPVKKHLIISRSTGGQKRKSTSPLKNSKLKVPKVEFKKPVKIILHEKPSSSKTGASQTGVKRDNGLQSLINSCKIPSSLSITIKESSEKDSLPLVAPPVKNFIEILKLPDETSSCSDKEMVQSADNKPKELTQLEISKFCDNDSEQKVDQDLAEIAKSLTEKIPMSTTVSQIVGPKQQFQIPVKTNIPQQFQIQPAPVPELNKALAGSPKDNLTKLNPRSPQTFQKIFEESLKKTPEGPKTSAVEAASDDSNVSPSSSKRNISEIASQLFKKTKLEQEQNQSDVKKEEVTLPKVLIPRLPNPRTSKSLLKKFEPDLLNKLVPQTVASLHSSSLGMNYTVSVNQHSPSKTTKVNGIVSPVKAESVPKVPECKPPVSPLNEIKSVTTDFKVPSPSLGSPKLPEVSSASSSPRAKTPSPKHSPKSSPLVKHMYAPAVPAFNQKVLSPMNRFASLSPKPSRSLSTSPRLRSISPKPPNPVPPAKTPQASPTSSAPNENNSAGLTPSEILEKYNIQNLAQLTANFNLNPSVVTTNQLAALQHAMLLKHFEMQNRHNWLIRNQGPLLQYEKYLQSLNSGLNGSQSNL